MLLCRELSDDISEYFKFEIAPYPMSLSTNTGMKKTTISTLYEFKSIDNNLLNKTDIYIIDGEYLLHKVKWNLKKKCSTGNYKELCDM